MQNLLLLYFFVLHMGDERLDSGLLYSLLEKPIPCILSWYEIHSNGQPKDLYEAIGVILLASVPAVCFIFRPASFSAGASDGMNCM